jgi:hypothetical protein
LIRSSAFAIAWAQAGFASGWAQDDRRRGSAVIGKIERIGQLADKAAKISRRHAGITAKLIHLIGGGFNQQRGLMRMGVTNGSFKYQWMCGTDGINTVCPPVYVVPPFLSDVSLSSPFRMVMRSIFRFVSFNTASW